jgi:hypothetical protein
MDTELFNTMLVPALGSELTRSVTILARRETDRMHAKIEKDNVFIVLV